MKIHHIGYLVKTMNKARAAFMAMGYEERSAECVDELRGIDICFLEKDGYCIELISPNRPDSVVSELIKRHRNAPYHICYGSTSFEQDIAILRKRKFVPLGEPAPAPALGGHRVLFMMHADMGMIEIIDFSIDT